MNNVEDLFFTCNNEFLASMNAVCENNKEDELIKELKRQNDNNEASHVKMKLALSSDMKIEELKNYLYKLENKKVITIDQIEYQKTKTNLNGFRCMLKVSLSEIAQLFSSSNNLALFLIKTLNFCTKKQKTSGLKQAFEIVKIQKNHVSFYTFAFKYENVQSSSMFSLFNVKNESCMFEKLSCSVTTTLEQIEAFVEEYSKNKSMSETRYIIKNS
jgi:hypothetical protein